MSLIRLDYLFLKKFAALLYSGNCRDTDICNFEMQEQMLSVGQHTQKEGFCSLLFERPTEF